MLFNSLEFAAFFPLVYAVYRLLGHRGQNRLLLLASYVFYGSWDVRFLALIALSTAVDFLCGLRIHESRDPRRRKLLLGVSLATNLGLLGAFKYFDFFAEGFLRLSAAFGLQVHAVTLDVVLPVGISFYTFQTLSYTIDVYRDRLEAEPDLLTFALFVAFFPQLVAGPIERARDLLPQLRQARTITREHVRSGLWLLLFGYFLKVFLADNLAPIVDRGFAPGGEATAFGVLVAVYAFAFQLFGDFAGYSSIALGCAALLGIRLSTNFLFPYFVTNPRDFWRHWHITLSSWLRDYLYVPLGGSRCSAWKVRRNLLVTMVLGGLWHGAGLTFVVWGAYHGLLLVAHRWVVGRLGDGLGEAESGPVRWPGGLWRLAKVIAMFHWTCLGLLIFRAVSLPQVGALLWTLATRWERPFVDEIVSAQSVLLLAALPVIVGLLQSRTGDVRRIEAIPRPLRAPLVAILVFLLLSWGRWQGAEFIYFQF
jgi:D-alanyl-lipoteichoic acid acyltransferase DltB (MBOAT superfamily)